MHIFWQAGTYFKKHFENCFFSDVLFFFHQLQNSKVVFGIFKVADKNPQVQGLVFLLTFEASEIF